MRTSKHLYANPVPIHLALAPSGVGARPGFRGCLSLLSRCVGKTGSVVEQGDPAFMTIALDGPPDDDRADQIDCRNSADLDHGHRNRVVPPTGREQQFSSVSLASWTSSANR